MSMAASPHVCGGGEGGKGALAHISDGSVATMGQVGMGRHHSRIVGNEYAVQLVIGALRQQLLAKEVRAFLTVAGSVAETTLPQLLLSCRDLTLRLSTRHDVDVQGTEEDASSYPTMSSCRSIMCLHALRACAECSVPWNK